MALSGKIAGISGIVAGILTPNIGGLGWRIAFIGGLITAPLIYWGASGGRPEIVFTHPLWMTAFGGVLVGFGARLGGGCTYGHGVCGIARLSRRSIAATAIFMMSAVITVFVLHHLLGF